MTVVDIISANEGMITRKNGAMMNVWQCEATTSDLRGSIKHFFVPRALFSEEPVGRFKVEFEPGDFTGDEVVAELEKIIVQSEPEAPSPIVSFDANIRIEDEICRNPSQSAMLGLLQIVIGLCLLFIVASVWRALGIGLEDIESISELGYWKGAPALLMTYVFVPWGLILATKGLLEFALSCLVMSSRLARLVEFASPPPILMTIERTYKWAPFLWVAVIYLTLAYAYYIPESPGASGIDLFSEMLWGCFLCVALLSIGMEVSERRGNGRA